MRVGCLVALAVLLSAGGARAEGRPAARKGANALAIRALGPAARPGKKVGKPAATRAGGRQAPRARRAVAVAPVRLVPPAATPAPPLLLTAPMTPVRPAYGADLPAFVDPMAARTFEDVVHALSTQRRVLDLVELMGAQGLQRQDPTWKGPVHPLATVRRGNPVFGVQGSF